MSIYSLFDRDNDIVEANPTTVTTGLWSDDTGSLESQLYVNTTQLGNSKEYYIDAYSKDPATNELAEVQFAVAYGHINGGGAPTLDINERATLPTKAIYSQYRNLLLNPSDTKFSFKGVESDHIYVINFQRARIREQLDAGNWELPLSGTNGLLTFIDDSGQTLGALTANSKAGRVFNVVSGSIAAAVSTTTASVHSSTWGGADGPGYGLVYPDMGVIILNPEAIGPAVGFLVSASTTATGSVASSSMVSGSGLYAAGTLSSVLQNAESPVYAPVTKSLTEGQWGTGTLATYNHAALFIAINKAISSGVYDRGFQARSAEVISSTHYFVRLRNKQFNYSNNPTFFNADNGVLVQSEFASDPKVYVTTVGLYNAQNELLAVAKLSKPVRKSFDEELLLRVRLDF